MELELDETWRDISYSSVGSHYMEIWTGEKMISFSFYKLKEASKKENMEYRDWFKEIKFLKDKVILPDGNRINKSDWVTSKGFDFDNFNKFLMDTYNKLYGG